MNEHDMIMFHGILPWPTDREEVMEWIKQGRNPFTAGWQKNNGFGGKLLSAGNTKPDQEHKSLSTQLAPPPGPKRMGQFSGL
jgi:hypothetical protein